MNVPATAAAVVAVVAVLAACYRSAVHWFVLRAAESHEAAGTAVPLPITGAEAPAATTAGFPWWALVALVSVVAATLFIWQAGYGSVLANMYHGIGRAAGRKARDYGVKAEVQRRLDAKARGTQAVSGRATRYARTAVALKGLARRFGDSSDVADAQPAQASADPTASAVPAVEPQPQRPKRRSVFDAMPPRVVNIDGAGASMPPRANPLREGSWALSHSVELTGA